MCRNIKTLYNFEPPTTPDEVRAAALQYVRKVSGMQKPSHANVEACARAVDAIARVTEELLDELVTSAPPRDRDLEAARRRARAEVRFGRVA
jgi:hypothetical protein